MIKTLITTEYTERIWRRYLVSCLCNKFSKWTPCIVSNDSFGKNRANDSADETCLTRRERWIITANWEQINFLGEIDGCFSLGQTVGTIPPRALIYFPPFPDADFLSAFQTIRLPFKPIPVSFEEWPRVDCNVFKQRFIKIRSNHLQTKSSLFFFFSTSSFSVDHVAYVCSRRRGIPLPETGWTRTTRITVARVSVNSARTMFPSAIWKRCKSLNHWRLVVRVRSNAERNLKAIY